MMKLNSAPERYYDVPKKKPELHRIPVSYLVPKRGLEPPRLAALDPKSSVSTSSTTSADIHFVRVVPKGRFELPRTCVH